MLWRQFCEHMFTINVLPFGGRRHSRSNTEVFSYLATTKYWSNVHNLGRAGVTSHPDPALFPDRHGFWGGLSHTNGKTQDFQGFGSETLGQRRPSPQGAAGVTSKFP